MQTYHFQEIVNPEGEVTLTVLPPLSKVAIVVIKPEDFDWQREMQAWMSDIRQRHPFMQMSKEEILEKLRQTREEVCAEVYGD